MARVPDQEIERLKAEVALEGLVAAAGVELHRAGADLVGRCPFHDDREPSLVISPGKNLWHCLGACQAGGSVIDWVMRAEGASFRHAVELLRAGAATRPLDGPVPSRSSSRRLASALGGEAGDAGLLAQVVAYYHTTLAGSAQALAYLGSRKVGHPEAMEVFALGYANRTLAYRLPTKGAKMGAELRGRLQALGVLRASGHEHFNGSVVVPIFDGTGAVTEMYGRKVRADLRPGTPAHLYLPGPHRGVWNRAGITGAGEVVLAESLIDALSFWCAGYRNVTAAYGTEGFTDELAEVLCAGTKRVLIAFDRDDAGDRAALRVGEALMARGTECLRVELPRGADANDVARAADDPAAVLGRYLRKAAWMGKGPAPVSSPPAGPPSRDEGPTVSPARPEPPPLAAEPPPAPALSAPALSAPALSVPALVPERAGPGEASFRLGERRWRVRGLDKVSSFDLLRLNVLVSHPDARAGPVFHVDTLDLYSARARAGFVKSAADELGLSEEVVKADLAKVLLACEALAELAISEAQSPKAAKVELSADERAAALELLGDPRLAERVVADFARAGVVGEEANCLVGYLAAVSRKLPGPLAVIVQSTSAAGKSALMDAVLAMVPAEERVKFSAMTGQSLYYMGEADLAGKVLAIAEEEGAERASYALKLLQSEGELSSASTGKDTASGRLVTHTYRVAGPVAIMLTTTAIDVDPELLNRCIVLAVDEGQAQTRAIHARQREAQTLAGHLAGAERHAVAKLHQDAQRLLEPLAVVNPFAPALSFPDRATRTRRDHAKYLALISAIALLHQHQRVKKTASAPGGKSFVYIEASAADVELANRLAHEVLGRSLDELPPGTRRLLEALDGIVAERAGAGAVARDQVRFSRRELREQTGWGDTQLKVHLARLVELELVVAHRAERGNGYCYELAWDGTGRDGERFVLGLAAPAGNDADRSGPGQPRSGPGRSPVGRLSGPGRDGPAPERQPPHNGLSAFSADERPERGVRANGKVVTVVGGQP